MELVKCVIYINILSKTLTINEYYTSQKCCECHQKINHYKDKKGVEIYRLFTCSKSHYSYKINMRKFLHWFNMVMLVRR